MRVLYVLLALIIPIGELHKLWIDVHKEVDVFLFLGYSLDLQWLIKDLGSMCQFSIVCYIAYRLISYIPGSKEIKLVLLVLFAYSLFDFVLYFLTFKTSWYGIIYYILALFVIVLNYRSKKKSRPWYKY